MLIKDLIAHINKAISQLPQNYKSNFFVQQESDLTIYELNQLLKKYDPSEKEPLNAEEEVTTKSAGLFTDFLKDRWLRIQNTDAVYPHHHMSPANQICVELAKKLADCLRISPTALLIPDLEVQTISLAELGPAIDITDLLHRVVLSDDNKRVIEIQQASAKLQHTTNLKGKSLDLSEAEKDRVIHHSKFSEAVHVKVLDKEGEWTEPNGLKRKKTSLRAHLARVVTQECQSSYGEAGCLLLQTNLQKKLQASLLNSKKTFAEAMTAQELYVGDESHARAAFLPFLMLYRVELKSRADEYSGKLGQLSGYDKNTKFNAMEVLYQFSCLLNH